MNMGKFYTSGFLLLVLLFIETLQLCLCKNSSFSCIEEERQALLKFKHSLQGSSLLWLSSWNGTDCCKWKGVNCSPSTGRVVKLDLQRTKFSEFWNESRSYPYLMADEVNSCLLELRHLNYLDLSGIDFQGTPFPKFFGLMKPLRYLNLSYTHFIGIVPSQLGNLTNLRVLDLNSLPSYPAPTIQNVEWVSHLLSLHHLDMSFINLRGAFNLMLALDRLPSLLVLHLFWCGLNNTHLSQAYVNSTFLSTVQYLDLRSNSFEGPIPHVLQNMTSLRALDLSFNSFNSSIPLWLGNFKSLVHLNLAYNKFNSIEGGSSTILWNLCHLKSFDLSYNYLLSGESLEPTYRNLSGCISYDLEELSLRGSGFIGQLPDRLGQLEKLKQLYLGRNSFNGPIPAALGRMSILRELDLSQNKLNGMIPDSLGQLINLESLDISSNSLEGVISEVHFANLSRLEELIIGFNHLAFKAKSDWLPSFQLKHIKMESCKIGTEFPKWLQTQREAIELVLSNASISGPFPKWFKNSHLVTLDLSHNQISGGLPQNIGDVMPALESLLLADNLINGTIPSSLCRIESLSDLDLSKNRLSGNIPKWFKNSHLVTLDLSHNQISGRLPHNIGDVMPTLESLFLADNLINGTIPSSLCRIETLTDLDLSKNRLSGNIPNCWSVSQHLWIINLSSNKLTGAIPSSIGYLYELYFLHLNNNSLTGELPLALKNCTELELLDLGENGFYGNIPNWIDGRLELLRILRLRKNMFNGSIPSQICNIIDLQILDLAENNLTGTIPHCLGNLRSMVLGGTSHGYMYDWIKQIAMEVIKGRELEFTSILRLVVNMDLSCNNLIGTIPEELTNLAGLLGLNLSHNHLRGSIPKNIGNLTSLESLDFSRNQLSGSIPQSMSALTFLSHLNLSYNNFSGPIPTGNQLQTLNDSSIYAGNLELCGGPLPKKCPGDEPPCVIIPNGYEDDNKEDKSEKVWFYVTLMLGYMTGLWGFLGVLLFKRSWRFALFQFVDEIYDWVFVAVAVMVARLKKKVERKHC